VRKRGLIPLTVSTPRLLGRLVATRKAAANDLSEMLPDGELLSGRTTMAYSYIVSQG
jgi:hypothetical protein